eukprot:CAMPEP_0203668772 /NCGR_PEP_ID=MMETSP0090-20130426/5322_1 /ASSEMBLY_ACC=CAM_ASM_001088 /TAXON_ID=426623 /ORGANISM="Chaetoceros affinis, Strain CCMP159" /LENGTH=460 /DNA_ID=CAMNT_0050533301 /DNA_START=59 /DNA_END=1441 /DNA_ORIENTATION=-
MMRSCVSFHHALSWKLQLQQPQQLRKLYYHRQLIAFSSNFRINHFSPLHKRGSQLSSSTTKLNDIHTLEGGTNYYANQEYLKRTIIPVRNSDDSDYDTCINDKSDTIKNLLVCGDGDLSFSADNAQSLNEANVNLIATVLEEQSVHEEVYQRSKANADMIQSYPGHQVKYGIDATKLETIFSFSDNTDTDTVTAKGFESGFDRIQFNFPHWRGKANHRYNRQLIDAFLKSASNVLADDGEIHIALCEGQGGCDARNLKEYRDTWTPAFFASNHGLLLMDVFPFSPSYNLSSHRGVDRGFKIGKAPEMYVFGKPNSDRTIKRKELMMCCRHELHIVLPDEYTLNMDQKGTNSPYSAREIIDGDAIKDIIESIIPQGIVVDVPERRFLTKDETGYDFDMVIYLVVYCGQSKVLRRDEADEYRHATECEVEKHVPLRENRRGRLVSRPFPYYLLQSIIDDHTS